MLRRGIKCNGEDCPPVSCGECGYNVTDKEWNEAFTKALEVLEEQEDGACGSRACISGEKTHVKTTDDFISRQSAIDAIYHVVKDHTTDPKCIAALMNASRLVRDIIPVRLCDTCRFTYYEKAKEEGDE